MKNFNTADFRKLSHNFIFHQIFIQSSWLIYYFIFSFFTALIILFSASWFTFINLSSLLWFFSLFYNLKFFCFNIYFFHFFTLQNFDETLFFKGNRTSKIFSHKSWFFFFHSIQICLLFSQNHWALVLNFLLFCIACEKYFCFAVLTILRGNHRLFLSLKVFYFFFALFKFRSITKTASTC